MTEFNPPISERKTEELIEIIYSGKGHWNEEAIRQSEQELTKRNISEKERDRVILKWKKEADDYFSELEKNLEQNQCESYSKLRMLYIFLVAPFIIVGNWKVGKGLIELQNENFKLKYKQRLILLITGTLFWIGFAFYGYKASEKERLKLSDEDEIELSDWKKKHGYDN